MRHWNESVVTRQSDIQLVPVGGIEAQEITLQKLWRVMCRRRRTVWVTVATSLVLAIVTTLIVPKRYEARARILINPESQNALGITPLDAGHSSYTDNELVQQTQVRIVESEPIAWNVVLQLRLDQRKEFAESDAASPGPSVNDISASRRAVLVEQLKKQLRVAGVPKTQLIEVRYRHSDPSLAAEIANAIANNYVESNFRGRYEATMQASDWLSRQLDDLKARASSSEQAFTEFQKKSGIVGADESHNIYVVRLEELNKQLATAQAERILREARFRVAQSRSPQLVTEIAPNSALAMLRNQQAELKSQLAQLNAKFGKAYPRVIQVTEQLTQVENSLDAEITNVVKRLESDYQAAVTTERLLNSQLETQKEEAYRRNEAGIQFAILKREVEANRGLYEDMQRRLKEAGILAGLRSTNIRVVEPAEPPTHPVQPRVLLNLLVGSLVGMIGGVIVAFVRDNFDTTIQGSEAGELPPGIPVLGEIPGAAMISRQAMDGMSENPVGYLTTGSGYSELAEAFRTLRSMLLLSCPGSPPRTVVVTSGMPGEGKTITSIGTAFMLAQRGKRVLLVDADLRRSPNIQHPLLDHAAPGLSECLAGLVNSAEVVRPSGVPNLDVMPAGDWPPNPAELLDSDAMRALLAKWSERYDHIIIDTPPLLEFADAMAPAAIADGVLLVARAEHTRKQALWRASEMLEQVRARTLGIVLNGVTRQSASYERHYEHNTVRHHRGSTC